jgi:hypothetical protein
MLYWLKILYSQFTVLVNAKLFIESVALIYNTLQPSTYILRLEGLMDQ